MNSSLSIFARALATENISFAFDGTAETASFDTKSRHLILPVWKVSETVQTMLIAHEISHALWTPYERSEELLAAAEKEGFNKQGLQRIANMIEDVRIEKLMKAKYPGTRRDFFLGYKEIVDADLFGFSQMDFTNMNIVNLLNLHFKWGVPGFLPINLTADQQMIADEVDAVDTFEEVIELAKKLYNHLGDKSTQDEEQGEKQGGASVDGEIVNEILNEGECNTDTMTKKKGEAYQASTIVFTGLKDYRKAIISTQAVRESFRAENRELVIKHYREFVRESDAFVRQLVAQFERRKAADSIRKERPKQTGMLNLDRLHQYRTHDDIFLSKIVKQDGKNHGIVFLLDMSGSMSLTLKDCFLQVLQLVWFCEKAKIPFEVFGFTDMSPRYTIPGYDEDYRKWYGNGKNEGKVFVHPMEPENARDALCAIQYDHSRLVNLASSRDSAEDRENLLSLLYSKFVTRDGSASSHLLSLHGTPTVEAVAIASQFMQDWVVTNNIQIPTIMVVTDGQPNGVTVKDNDKANLYEYGARQGVLTVVNEILGTVHRVDWAINGGGDLSNIVIGTLLESLREKLNARCVGMFVGGNNFLERDYIQFCMSLKERDEFYNKGYHSRGSTVNSARFKAAKEAYADGTVIVHPSVFPGYDAFFLTKTPKIVKDEDACKNEGNFTKVKNQFVRVMSKRGGNRVFLARYIDIVAGQPVNKGVDAIYRHPAF